MGTYSFTSVLEDDDQISMNVQEAKNYISGTMDSDLNKMCGALQGLVTDLQTMQARQYGAPGTNVDEDYKDFEALTEALSDFLVECNRVLDDVYSYIESTERTLYN